MLTVSQYASWLENEANEIFAKLLRKETLTTEDRLVLILKNQSDQLRQISEFLILRIDKLDRQTEAIEKNLAGYTLEIQRGPQRLFRYALIVVATSAAILLMMGLAKQRGWV